MGRRGSRLGAPPHVLVEGRDGEADAHLRAGGRLGEHVDVTHDQGPAGDDVERVRRGGEHLEAAAGEYVASLGGLVRVGRRPDGYRARLATTAGKLRAQHLCDVHLDADREAVRVAGRPVGSPFERPHVAERAAVHAAHVRVERPGERHALHGVERRLARLFPVLHSHRFRIERMFVYVNGRFPSPPAPVPPPRSPILRSKHLGRRAAAQYARPGGRGVTIPLELARRSR